MGISTLQIFRQGLNSILDQQAGIQRTQQQVSSGKRILDPSDDPAGATRVMSLTDTENITNQYQNNIINLRNRLEAEEAVLSAGGEVMQRINELAIEGLNDSLSANDRASIAKEVRQLTDEMVGLANRKDGSGEDGVGLKTLASVRRGSARTLRGIQKPLRSLALLTGDDWRRFHSSWAATAARISLSSSA